MLRLARDNTGEMTTFATFPVPIDNIFQCEGDFCLTLRDGKALTVNQHQSDGIPVATNALRLVKSGLSLLLLDRNFEVTYRLSTKGEGEFVPLMNVPPQMGRVVRLDAGQSYFALFDDLGQLFLMRIRYFLLFILVCLFCFNGFVVTALLREVLYSSPPLFLCSSVSRSFSIRSCVPFLLCSPSLTAVCEGALLKLNG